MGSPGRPDKLTDEVADSIVNDLRDGVPMRWAAIRAGIAERTLHRWMEEGQAAEHAEDPEVRKFWHFRQRVLLARAALLHEACQVKRKHLKHGNPKVSGPASTFVLTQMFSSDFSTKTRVETTGADGKPIAVEHAGPGGGPIPVQPLLGADAVAAMVDGQLGEALRTLITKRETE